jgi:hypothetical protein
VPDLIAGRDVEPAFSWGFFDRLFLIVTERVGELVVIFGDQIDIALVLDRGDRRLQRVIELVNRLFSRTLSWASHSSFVGGREC